MLVRLILIAIVGFTMHGYLPRWLTTGEAAWLVWAVAAVIVLAGPRLARALIARILRSAGAGRLRNRPAVLSRNSGGIA